MAPAEQFFISGDERRIVANGGGSNETVCWIAMQAVEFAGKNGDFAGERQFADAGTQYEIASFRCRIDGADASLGDEQRDLPKTYNTDG